MRPEMWCTEHQTSRKTLPMRFRFEVWMPDEIGRSGFFSSFLFFSCAWFFFTSRTTGGKQKLVAHPASYSPVQRSLQRRHWLHQHRQPPRQLLRRPHPSASKNHKRLAPTNGWEYYIWYHKSIFAVGGFNRAIGETGTQNHAFERPSDIFWSASHDPEDEVDTTIWYVGQNENNFRIVTSRDWTLYNTAVLGRWQCTLCKIHRNFRKWNDQPHAQQIEPTARLGTTVLWELRTASQQAHTQQYQVKNLSPTDMCVGTI